MTSKKIIQKVYKKDYQKKIIKKKLSQKRFHKIRRLQNDEKRKFKYKRKTKGSICMCP